MKVFGRLGDLGEVDNQYDVAVSTASSALDYIVVQSAEDAQACIEYLKKYNKNKLNNLYINYYDGGGEVVAAPSLSHISGADISTPSVSGPSSPSALKIDTSAIPQVKTKTPFLKNALKPEKLAMPLVNKGVGLVSGALSSAIGGGL